jgi:predicted neuraminidase
MPNRVPWNIHHGLLPRGTVEREMLMRATRRVGFVCTASSDDYGRSWSPASPTDIPNPNSGLDAVRLPDGRIVLACNPTRKGRTPLSLLVSEDNGVTWPWRKDLETEAGEYSYPSVIQAADGQVHGVYTYRRKQIRHFVWHPDDLTAA